MRKVFAVIAVLHAVVNACLLAGASLDAWEMSLSIGVLALLPALFVLLIAWPWSSDKLPMESLVTLVVSVGGLAWFSCVVEGIYTQSFASDAEIMCFLGLMTAPIAAIMVVLCSMVGVRLIRSIQKRGRS